MPDIFQPRVNIKPYEYPRLIKYKDSMFESFWTFKQFTYTEDIQDYKVILNDKERNVIKNCMLAISQIEIQVKLYWSQISNFLPKSEISDVGVVFAASEVRHKDAYSHLLELLNLNKEFETVLEVPAIKARIKYLDKFMAPVPTPDSGVDPLEFSRKKFVNKNTLFALFVENVSLFSQFLIMMSFNKEKNVLKGISNVIQDTSLEENLHAKFGAELTNIIFQENPSWFTEELKHDIQRMCKKAYVAEHKVLKWIFERGELDFITLKTVDEFIKNRFNESLQMVNIDPIFEVDEEELKKVEWFDLQLTAVSEGDFFYKKLSDYNKKNKAITADNIFE